jgi:hypothetical protein
MPKPTVVLIVGLVVAALGLPVDTVAQDTSPGGWLTPNWDKQPITDANRKPAPRRSLAGTWGPAGGPAAGTQAGGVQLKPNYAIRLGTLPVPQGARGRRRRSPDPG